MIATEQKTEQNFDNFSSVLDRLDEFGLTPIQFRIYCHLFKNAVDGVVSESSESIARVCKLTRITVIRVVSDLSKMNLIQCDRTAGKKTVFHLKPCSDWRQLVPKQKQPIAKQQSKVVQLRGGDSCQLLSDTCKPDLPVNEFNTQQAREEYPIGYSSLAPASKPVNEIDVSTADTAQLDEKLAAARERGWGDTGTWWNDLGQQMVTVNRFVVSVAEFMGRSLDSFDVGRQICAEGLAMCRKQIEKIKQRKSQQLCDRAMAIASS
ncbi:MAG: hypothetical protein N4J56_007581 [Chroococcidiopsis sp. SAG 2025]|uniref:hypothetical protein n=1 Tax=Chroococcidiopsis sp. SAG 2025 TaxID=171389 RepID=UPI0029373775|nr:hypothetical protein [Chroococcidiopsis sp. SAG 2025]MDV2997876.1 hypothetical protein [Chroococcidiopsis sp. SAG 2025]